MKKHLNTVYVTTPGAYLSLEGEAIVVKADGAVKGRLPMHMLESIVCFGPVSYTHLRAHETPEHLVCRLLLEKKKNNTI